MIDVENLIEAGVAFAGTLGAAVKTVTWAVRKNLESKEKREAQFQAFLTNQESERKAALAMLQSQHMAESARCQEANLSLVARLESVQDRQEKYSREDQQRLITVLDRAIEATANSTRAYDRLTDQLNNSRH